MSCTQICVNVAVKLGTYIYFLSSNHLWPCIFLQEHGAERRRAMYIRRAGFVDEVQIVVKSWTPCKALSTSERVDNCLELSATTILQPSVSIFLKSVDNLLLWRLCQFHCNLLWCILVLENTQISESLLLAYFISLHGYMPCSAVPYIRTPSSSFTSSRPDEEAIVKTCCEVYIARKDCIWRSDCERNYGKPNSLNWVTGYCQWKRRRTWLTVPNFRGYKIWRAMIQHLTLVENC